MRQPPPPPPVQQPQSASNAVNNPAQSGFEDIFKKLMPNANLNFGSRNTHHQGWGHFPKFYWFLKFSKTTTNQQPQSQPIDMFRPSVHGEFFFEFLIGSN